MSIGYKILPRIMGNCARCCYATRKMKDGSCVCARNPKWVDIIDADNHFCGEFVSNQDYAKVCNGVEQ